MMPLKGTIGVGQDMFDAMASYVRDYKESFQAAQRVDLKPPKHVASGVFTGMGGSGISGALIAALCEETAPFPIVIVKGYHLPRFVGPDSLVVATSYSGDTEETLYTVAEAMALKASIAGIASGGALEKFCTRNRHPFLKIPSGRQPRAALPLLFGGLAGLVSKLGVTGLKLEAREENTLNNIMVRVQPHPAGADNDALRLAEFIRAKTPTIYADGILWPVAQRFKAQLNENAKTFARAERMPEANHNDLVAWGMGKPGKHDALVLLRRKNETAPTRARFDFVQGVAEQARVPTRSLFAESTSNLGAMLEHLILTDYASVYSAVLQGIDPAAVPIISALKKRLETDGWASEARKRLGL